MKKTSRTALQRDTDTTHVSTESEMKNPLLLTPAIDLQSTSRQFGCIDRIDDEGIHGWVLDLDHPTEVLSIHFVLNGNQLGCAYAATVRPDISAIVGRPVCAGFSFKWRQREATAEVAQILKSQLRELRIDATLGIDGPRLSFVGTPPNTKDLLRMLSYSATQPMSPSTAKKLIQEFPGQNVEMDTAGGHDVRAIAFYLPQFHPVPENDEWWGPGFTEWTNVVQGKPMFPEHVQPHVPADLGFYDLRLPEVRAAQASLAKEHGIHGFCYYYYWFGGRRILERPLQEVLESGEPDFPFCICWANETWSRRWDGSESEVLLKQEHTLENDVKFIADVIPILKDRRYIRVDGAPILLIYRTELFPNPAKTAEIWRKICRENGIEKIHLCAVESFGFNDPLSIGFDSSVQFPPHGVVAANVRDEVAGLDPEFGGNIYDFEEVVAREINTEAPIYPRYPGVMCSWDNTARRKKNGNIFINSSPENYEVWLRAAVDRAKEQLPAGQQLVFINAWNEWAEGTHLEPDRKYGHGYLQATKRALQGISDWKQLLKYAKTNKSLSDVALTNLLDDLGSTLRAQERSIKYLSEIHQNIVTGSTARAVFSAVSPMQLVSAPLLVGNLGCIDGIGQEIPNGNSIISLPRGKWTYFTGWVVTPDSQLLENSPAYIVLENVQTRERYFALLSNRKLRTDVAAAFPDRPAEETNFSGFACYLDVTKVPSAQYRLGLIQLGINANYLKMFEGIYDLA